MDLTGLGWNRSFAAHLRSPEDDGLVPSRVMAIHRTGHVLSDGEGECEVHLGRFWFRGSAEERPTVGDWVLTDAERSRIERCLPRNNVLKRVAAGSQGEVQLIGANVDKLFVVTSCNAEFSAARLKRYLALAASEDIEALIVLTKADLAADPQRYRGQATEAAPGLPVEVVNALDGATLDGVRKWLHPGRTIALLGSSGVGKSTLLNTLAGNEVQVTRPIREQDAKGRHTTTHRSLNPLPDGTLVLDGPGMRELGVVLGEHDLDEFYDDVEALASRCRYSNCRHETEPDCAVRAEIEAGRLDPRRLRDYQALTAERQRQQTSATDRRRRAGRLERSRRSGLRCDGDD
ncbi:MAG: ribosome small subunit-dependent GTPase A [Gammaproteobacteria bacterium]|nr:ribosome small subunit-dependent GTPase A [Gammaproteobacteria bacterium]